MDFLSNLHYQWMQNDPRVADLPLINSIYLIPLLICSYLYFLFDYGPRFMKNRQPYSLKTFMLIYNSVQFMINTWFVYANLDIFTNTNIICFGNWDYSYDPFSLKIMRICYYYFLIKIFDYVETIVFVLRKKNNQLSYLHLYHHISTLLMTWYCVRYYAIALMLFSGWVNCLIHAIMYSYYFLAACGANIQKIIAPIKSWITIAQMVQFSILILYTSQNFLPNCKFVTHREALLFNGNIIINFYLFYKFYQESYKKPRRKIR